jgi:transposase-like protein
MLVELSVVEQRYQAVLAVIRDGVPIVQVAPRLDVSRQAVHRWMRWYEAQGLAGLVDRSHRSPRCSHQPDLHSPTESPGHGAISVQALLPLLPLACRQS